MGEASRWVGRWWREVGSGYIAGWPGVIVVSVNERGSAKIPRGYYRWFPTRQTGFPPRSRWISMSDPGRVRPVILPSPLGRGAGGEGRGIVPRPRSSPAFLPSPSGRGAGGEGRGTTSEIQSRLRALPNDVPRPSPQPSPKGRGSQRSRLRALPNDVPRPSPRPSPGGEREEEAELRNLARRSRLLVVAFGQVLEVGADQDGG